MTATTDSALGVFTDAIAKHDARMKNVWFDATAVVRPGMSPDDLQRIAARIRQIGVERVLYGSDARREPSRVPEGGLGGVPTTPADPGRVPRHREQRYAVHA